MTNWVAVSSLTLTALAVICSCLNVGLVTGREKLRADRSKIGWLASAIVLNFVLMPLLALGLIWAFDLEAGLAASLVLLSALPAFPLILSIMRGKAIDANGLELTFLMLGISVISAPLIIWWSPVEGLDASLTELMLTMVLFQLFPLVIGYLLGRIKPQLYEQLQDILTFLIFVSTSLVVLYVIVSRYNDIGNMGGTHALLAAISMVLMGAFLGWVMGGPRKEGRRTLALNTSLRNFMSCLLIVFIFFSGAGTELLVLLGGLFMVALGIILEKIPVR